MWQIINDFIGNAFLTIGVFIFGRIVLDKSFKLSKFKLFFDIFFCTLVYTVIMIYFSEMMKTCFMGVIIFLFNKIIFKEKNSKTLFITFLYMLLVLVLDILMLFLVTEILSKHFIYYIFAGSIIGNIIIQILLVIITIILKKFFKKLINTKIENNTKIIIFSILTLGCSIMFFYTLVRKFKFNNDIFLYLISIIVLVTVLISLIKQTLNNYKLTNEYDRLLEFMTTYENEIENQRILRHEIKNEFRTIRAKICDNQKNKEIIEYIDEILNDRYKINHEKYAKFGYLPANGIKGLCYFKVQEAEEKGINVA